MKTLNLEQLTEINGGSKAAFCGAAGVTGALWTFGTAVGWIPAVGQAAAITAAALGVGLAVYCAY